MLLVAFLPTEAVSLVGVAAKAALAIGEKLLARDEHASAVNLDLRAAEMVGERVADRWPGVVRRRRADAHPREALHRLADMHRVVPTRRPRRRGQDKSLEEP